MKNTSSRKYINPTFCHVTHLFNLTLTYFYQITGTLHNTEILSNVTVFVLHKFDVKLVRRSVQDRSDGIRANAPLVHAAFWQTFNCHTHRMR